MPRLLAEREVAGQELLERVRRKRRGVDHHVGRIAHPADLLALLADAVVHRPVGRQRMRPARFGVAALQGLAVAIEEQQARGDVGRAGAARACGARGRADRSRRCGCRRRRPAAPPSRRGCRRSSASGRRAAAAARCRPRRSPCPRAHAAPCRGRRRTGPSPGRTGGACRVGGGGRRSPGCRAWLKRADHALAICAKARRNFAEAEASNGARASDRQVDAQDRFAVQARAGARFARAATRSTSRATAARAHQLITARASRCRARAPRSGRRCAPARWRSARLPCAAELGLVVGDQAAAGLDQAQREVGLAGARGPAQQHGAPCPALAQRHAGGVDAITSLRSLAREVGGRHADGEARAQHAVPSGGARRLVAEIEPP